MLARAVRLLVIILAFITLTGCLRDVAPGNEPATGPRLGQEAEPAPGGDAAMRIECDRVKTGAFDPIVAPGVEGEANGLHSHDFYGSSAISKDMTDPTSGTGSTCNGGTLNKSVYWVPSMMDTSTWDGVSQTFERIPEMSGLYMRPIQVYYKAGYIGVSAASIQQWFPTGLRIIAGQPASSMTSGAEMNRLVSWWDCLENGNAQSIIGNMSFVGGIPSDCPAGAFVQGVIQVPQCWDGRNLDSPDHRSHMAYGAGWPDKGCPESHPVPLPQVTMHVRWRVPQAGSPKHVGGTKCTEWVNVNLAEHGWAGNPNHYGWPSDGVSDGPNDDLTDPNDDPDVADDHCSLYDRDRTGADLRLSSDMYNGPAGRSLHGDEFFGWNEEVGQRIIDNCFQIERDCGMNGIGPNEAGQWEYLADPAP
jgi:hypothetical protein